MVDLVKGDPWIQANYLETQITYIRKGDTADIKVTPSRGWCCMERWKKSRHQLMC